MSSVSPRDWLLTILGGLVAGAVIGTLFYLGIPQNILRVGPRIILAGACQGALLTLAIRAALAVPISGWKSRLLMLIRAYLLGAASCWLGAAGKWVLDNPDFVWDYWVVWGLIGGGPLALGVAAPHLIGERSKLLILLLIPFGSALGAIPWCWFEAYCETSRFMAFQLLDPHIPTALCDGYIFGVCYALSSMQRSLKG